MAIRFTCDCGQTLAVGDEHAGKSVRCTACKAVKVVPSAPPVALPVKAAPPAAIRFSCADCGQVVQARGEHTGKQTKCPGCGKVLTIPAAAAHVKMPVAVQANKPAPPPIPVRNETRSERPNAPVPSKRKVPSPGILIAAGAGLLLLLGVGVWLLFFRGGSTPDNPDGPGGDAVADDFIVVPGDALGFGSIRVAELLKHDLAKKALALTRELAGKDMTQFEKLFGLTTTTAGALWSAWPTAPCASCHRRSATKP